MIDGLDTLEAQPHTGHCCPNRDIEDGPRSNICHGAQAK
jgi:hypothetical protein